MMLEFDSRQIPERETRQQRFQALLDEHRRIVFRVCGVYGGTPEDREDLAQEIVLQLWRSFPSFDPERRFSTWMYRIALNIAISFRRRNRGRAREAPFGEELLAGVAEAPRSEELRTLYRLVERLAPLDRSLVVLYLEGYSHCEIGDILGISETNAATRVNRLKQELREASLPPKQGKGPIND